MLGIGILTPPTIMYWNITDKERLITAFTMADKHDLVKRFLYDILTEKEIRECEIRLKAMCLLHDLATYTQIQSITGLAPATIARLSKKVNNRKSGFVEIIEKFKKIGPAYSD